MLPLERREAWLVQADGQAAEALAALLPRVPLRVLSPALVADGRHRLGNGPLVVTGQALHDPHTADKLTELALAGVRLLRLRDYYERKLRRVMLDDLDDTWFLFDRPLRRRPVYSTLKAAVDLAAGLVGSLLAVGMFLSTLSFLVTTPGAWADEIGGFPAIGVLGQFLIKDVALLGIAVWVTGDSLERVRANK